MRDELQAIPDRRQEGYTDPGPLLVHIHISRTGGSTLNHILKSSYGARHCPVEPWASRWGPEPFTVDDLRALLRLYPNLKSIAGHRLYGYVDLATPDRSAAYFALVRDPVKACASRFQHKVEKTGKDLGDFESWIEKDWVRNRHTKAIVGSDDVDAAVRLIRDKDMFVGLTEQYDASMILLKRLLAPDLDISYQPVNVAGKRTVSQRLLSDERYRNLIEDAQAADLELHRRVRDELWPEYVERYGPGFESDLERYAAHRGSFSRLNIVRSRVKTYALYKPALWAHRLRNRTDNASA